MFDDRTLKQELDDANTKIAILEERCDEYSAKIAHYEREMEEMEFRMEDMRQQQVVVSRYAGRLGEEGVRQSQYMGSRYFDGDVMRSKMSVLPVPMGDSDNSNGRQS